jgi:hypothetical protein
MEMRSTINIQKLVRYGLCIWLLLLLGFLQVSAQPRVKNYTIKNGKMYIALGRMLPESSLDSFITQYDLRDLDLKVFMKTGMADSLKNRGWSVDIVNKEVVIISKRLMGYDDVSNPTDKIMLADQNAKFAERFPVVSARVKYGYNRFKNKKPFAVKDSAVTFFLRGNSNARRVILSGSFIDWSEQALSMTKVDSGWIFIVKLGAGKYWYKFIIDGNWDVDRDNSWMENDGLGNDNSVYFKTNVNFRLQGYQEAKRVIVSGSFNDWRPRELVMTKTGGGWELPMYLANGTHTYRFVADDNWFADPGNPNKLPNEFNQFNSVIRLGKPYVFRLDGYTEAKQVVLSGSFNGWRKEELFMTKTTTGWELPYSLGPGNYEYTFLVDGKDIVKRGGIENRGNQYFVIDPNYTFRLKGYAGAKKVYLAGDFNNWSSNTFVMTKQGDDWIFAVHLSPGKHLYKFVVDGKWIIDPGNKLWEQNVEGTGNSIVWIN